MSAFRILKKSVLALLVALGLSTASVQAIPPVGKVIKVDQKIKTAADENALRHGMRVALTLKGKQDRLVGTVVWVDNKNDVLLLRPQAGAVPIKVAGQDITAVDRIRLVAADGSMRSDQPEIFKATEINGSMVTVKYFAPMLSPGELEQLRGMEAAENQAAHLQQQQSMLGRMVRDQLETMDLQRSVLANQRIIMDTYATEFTWLSSFAPYGSTWKIGGDFGGWLPQGTPASLLATSGGGFGFGAAATAPTVDALMSKQSTVAGALAKARETLAAARVHGLYENGALVAVMPQQQGKVMPAAAQ